MGIINYYAYIQKIEHLEKCEVRTFILYLHYSFILLQAISVSMIQQFFVVCYMEQYTTITFEIKNLLVEIKN